MENQEQQSQAKRYTKPETQFTQYIKITEVLDGDTYVGYDLKTNKEVTIRLFGVDSPEKKQTLGNWITEEVNQLLLNKTVRCDILSNGPYDRNIANVYIRSHSNEVFDLSYVLIQKGLSMAYNVDAENALEDPYVVFQESIIADMRHGLKPRKGLWKKDGYLNKNYETPSEYRQRRKDDPNSPEETLLKPKGEPLIIKHKPLKTARSISGLDTLINKRKQLKNNRKSEYLSKKEQLNKDIELLKLKRNNPEKYKELISESKDNFSIKDKTNDIFDHIDSEFYDATLDNDFVDEFSTEEEPIFTNERVEPSVFSDIASSFEENSVSEDENMIELPNFHEDDEEISEEEPELEAEGSEDNLDLLDENDDVIKIDPKNLISDDDIRFLFSDLEDEPTLASEVNEVKNKKKPNP